MRNSLLCCDWGTSSFRLRLVDKGTLKVMGEEISEAGISTTFNSWKKSAEPKGITRFDFFSQQLRTFIDSLADKLSVDLHQIPLVISGMATSSIGMQELPYASLPFSVDGTDAYVGCFKAQADFPHALYLISGVRSEQDVMRGEETQLIGLIKLLDNASFYSGETVFIFPGTHSKHIYVANHKVVEFKTFITGEIFSLLSQHSILKSAVESPGFTSFADQDNLEGFRRGLQVSASSNILNSLFTVRTNQLFASLEKVQNFFYLSGLLIGTEIRDLVQKRPFQLVVCSGSNLYDFYKKGFQELNMLEGTTFIEPDLIDKATVTGQVLMYQNQEKNDK